MRYGVHLPVMDWDGTPFGIDRQVAVARTAEALGFDTLSANDHLVFRRAWLDGPTALAAVIASSTTSRLMTSVALPVVRGPVALAKALAAIDLLSGGRVVAGLGPGSTALDYEAVGIPFEERWARFDEAVRAMRALWDPTAEPFVGRFYDTRGVELAPAPAQPGGPPIWIGSWGSSAGLRRVARLADGWLASAYNTTPERFANARRELADHLMTASREPDGFPNTLVTMWLHLTDDESERIDVLRRLASLLRRDSAELEGLLPIGPAGLCADLVARYREAGVERIVFWPLTDEVRQIEALAEAMAQVAAGPTPRATAVPGFPSRSRTLTDMVSQRLDRTGYELEVEDTFDGPILDETLWVPRYLPHWTSAERAAARYDVGGGTLRLRIDADQPAWIPEHTGEMRVSSLQTGSYAGPVGSTIGQNRTHDGMVVQQAIAPTALYTPTYGLIELRARFTDDPTWMAALWMIGYADEPERTGEICIAEVFGRDVDSDSVGVGMGTRRFGDPSLHGDFSVERVAVDAREPHWYAAEWTPDGVSFYVDERLVKVVPESPAYPMQLMLGLFEFREPGLQSAYPKTFDAGPLRCWRLRRT